MFRKTLIASALAAVLASTSYAAMTKNEVKAQEDRIAAEFKSGKARCDQLSGNAEDVCMAEAKGKEKVAKAELEARRKDNTPQALYDVRVAKADAAYDVAKEKCDDHSGNAKDVCMKDAKAALTTAKADAKVEREAGKNQARSHERVSEAQVDAAQDKRKAEYAAARERCDNYAGDAKDRCLADAKNRHGMN
jgi:hypothetical protein